MPPGKPHKHPEHHKTESDHAFNTPENATTAISTCRSSLVHFTAGRVWRHIHPHGELEIKGTLKLGECEVLMLRFNPEDGSILPKGLHALTEGRKDVIPQIELRLIDICSDLSVLDGAEFREPESCWAIPVAFKGRIVAHLKVSADGSRILPEKIK